MQATAMQTNSKTNSFLLNLHILADIFNLLNDLNLSLQGKDTNILMLSDKAMGFRKKLGVWRTRLENGIAGMFPLLREFLSNSEIGLPSIKEVLIAHVNAWDAQFETYFRDISDNTWRWIRAPFSEDVVSNTKPYLPSQRSAGGFVM